MRDHEPIIDLRLVILLALAATIADKYLPAPHHAGGEPVLAIINLWVQLAIMIVSAIISYALTPKPPSPKPAALTDFDVPTAEEGRSIPVIFGTVWIKGPNVLWYGDLRSTPIKSGGKK